MGVDVRRPAFNLEPKYRVTMLTREEWNRGPGTPPEVQGLLWYTNPERQRGWCWGLWAIIGKKAQYLCRKTCYSFSC